LLKKLSNKNETILITSSLNLQASSSALLALLAAAAAAAAKASASAASSSRSSRSAVRRAYQQTMVIRNSFRFYYQINISQYTFITKKLTKFKNKKIEKRNI